MITTRHFALPLLLALSTAGTAQTTWIVDASSGPGTNFTTLVAAAAAAADGDTIRVRAGVYEPATFSGKGLTLLGEPGAVVTSFFFGTSLHVSNVPAGKLFHVVGFDLISSSQFSSIRPGLIAENIAGTLHVQDVDQLRLAQITNCNLVTIGECTVTSIWVDSSTVSVSACTVGALAGADAGLLTPPAAIQLLSTTRRSQLYVMQSSVTGAPGTSLPPFIEFENSAAIRATASNVEVAGDATDSIRAGQPLAGQAALAAIVGDATSQLRLDPHVQLVPNAGAPATSGIAIIPRRPTTCVATNARLGSTLDLTTISAPNEFIAILFGTAGTQSLTPANGTLWLLPANILVVEFTGPSGRLDYAIPLLADPAFTGLALSFQAAAGPLPVWLSGPSTVVLR